ncbi:hypothetical protein PGT21_005559 [Puccinia graminis f. sp. tritici]|uniref:Uncharacterized protein n=1 Tax=Puccinia graminis f. sp. tritici TaxID=56615 RepID=A0A5B0ME54_PUCGR|nr:hypothetical protein PGT21_005559 [Puccinia graminis f. sp. tritici]
MEVQTQGPRFSKGNLAFVQYITGPANFERKLSCSIGSADDLNGNGPPQRGATTPTPFQPEASDYLNKLALLMHQIIDSRTIQDSRRLQVKCASV